MIEKSLKRICMYCRAYVFIRRPDGPWLYCSTHKKYFASQDPLARRRMHRRPPGERTCPKWESK